MSDMVESAKRFAWRAHREQQRKYTSLPYFTHLEEVAGLCAAHGCDDTIIAAAYLHDTIEDQPITFEALDAAFGREVADIVLWLTDSTTGNRQHRKQMDVVRLAMAPASAQTIKCADLISNTSSIVRYDPGFAKVYLPEKRATLEVLVYANTALLEKAWACLVEAEHSLGIAGKTAQGEQ